MNLNLRSVNWKFWQNWRKKKNTNPNAVPYVKLAILFGVFNGISITAAILLLSLIFAVVEKVTQPSPQTYVVPSPSILPSPSPDPYDYYSNANLHAYLRVDGDTLPETMKELEQKREKVKEILLRYVEEKDFKMGTLSVNNDDRNGQGFYGSTDFAVYFSADYLKSIDFEKLSKELKAVGADFSSIYTP
jgi:hypothetical protein